MSRLARAGFLCSWPGFSFNPRAPFYGRTLTARAGAGLAKDGSAGPETPGSAQDRAQEGVSSRFVIFCTVDCTYRERRLGVSFLGGAGALHQQKRSGSAIHGFVHERYSTKPLIRTKCSWSVQSRVQKITNFELTPSRSHAYDPQRSDANEGQIAASAAVLCSRCVNLASRSTPASSAWIICDTARNHGRGHGFMILEARLTLSLRPAAVKLTVPQNQPRPRQGQGRG